MKNKTKFVKELIITLIVASLLSSVIVIILAFILANLGAPTHVVMYVNSIGAAAWGIFIGYKINTLLREYR